MLGDGAGLGTFYHLGLAVALGLFGYQQYLIRNRSRDGCFKAFRNNIWVGFALFAGVVLETTLVPALTHAGGAGL